MATLHFELVSPEKLVFSGEVEQVDVPGAEGDFGVLAGHAPMVTTLRPGMLTVKAAGGEQKIVVLGGFAEVSAKGLTVLADTAIRGKDLDEAKASEAKQLAEEAMKNAKSDIDFAKAQGEFATMAAQIAALRKYRKK